MYVKVQQLCFIESRIHLSQVHVCELAVEALTYLVIAALLIFIAIFTNYLWRLNIIWCLVQCPKARYIRRAIYLQLWLDAKWYLN